MKEAADMSLIGPVLKEQQKIVDSAIEKKLQSSKLMATIMSKNLESSSSVHALGGDVKEALQDLLRDKSSEEDDDKTTLNYKM